MTARADPSERSPAFQGARLAFSSPSGSATVPKSPNNTYSGSRGALAAANSAGKGIRGNPGYNAAASGKRWDAAVTRHQDNATPSYIAANHAARTSAEFLPGSPSSPLLPKQPRPSSLRSYSDLSGVANTDGPSIHALIRCYEREDYEVPAAGNQHSLPANNSSALKTLRNRSTSHSMRPKATSRLSGSGIAFTPSLSQSPSSSTDSSNTSTADKPTIQRKGSNVLDTRTTLRPPPNPLSRPVSTFDRRKSSNNSITSNPRRIEPLLSNSFIPQLSADSLADAMVASSLASSRAPSQTRPPLPPPRRRSRPHLFHRAHSADESKSSRTPSPSKGLMRTTMRAPLDPDEDLAKHKSSKRFIHKHPNKHHEGDRKRWRDQITEFERKRYEGVWAANRGLLMSSAYPHVQSDNNNNTLSPPPTQPGVTARTTTGNNNVLNIIVQDIWSRSHLPPDALEEIWDLVNRDGTSVLGKEEFVVGMWLVDQRLKGRKLPGKVSDSVWFSARGLTGVKVRRR